MEVTISHWLIILIVGNLCAGKTDGTTFKSSTDELVLKFLAHLSTPNLIGEPRSNHQFHFELQNNGAVRSVFQLSQAADHKFEGQLYPGQSVTLEPKTVKTITVLNLVVPDVELGTIMSFTLTATKDNVIGGKMSEVSSSINFLVGRPEDLIDDEKPVVTTEYGGTCLVPKNDTKCANFQWQLEYHVQDSTAGLLSVDVSATGRDSILRPVFYKMPNFAIGSREKIDVTVDVSCCIGGVKIRAVDVHGNEANLDSLRDHSGSMMIFPNVFSTIICITSTFLMSTKLFH